MMNLDKVVFCLEVSGRGGHKRAKQNSFLVHKGNKRNFIILYNTLGFCALQKFEAPYLMEIVMLKCALVC
jgi:hypothetical protein